MSYYSVNKVSADEGMNLLRSIFPDGLADDLNFCLFSTSGIHGSYCTIEDCEKGEVDSVTFVVVKPRIVSVVYGNCRPTAPEDFAYLKKLRESSWKAVREIGADRAEAESQREGQQECVGAPYCIGCPDGCNLCGLSTPPEPRT